jgi:hypothetical protein
MPWWLPIAALAGAKTLSTAIQNKRDKKAYSAAQAQNEQRRSDYYVNLRNDAQKGGFNPLTALRSGGGMGYSSLAGRITQPLMTRSPLAAGIDMGAGVYRGMFFRALDYSHDERMTRLRAKLDRATDLAVAKTYMPAFGGSNVVQMPSAGSGEIPQITRDPLVPGVNKTLDDIWAETPIKNEVKETVGGTNVNRTMLSPLFPLAMPFTDKMLYVPWNPEDADLGAIAGGILQFGATLPIEMGYRLGNRIDDWRASKIWPVE